MSNRKIEIGLVKKKKTEETDGDQEQELFDHKAEVTKEIIENSIIKVGIVIFAYILLDTARQVVVKSTGK